MDFDLTEEEREFKLQVCRFLDREVTRGVIEESEAGLGYGSHSWELIRNLGAKGWLAPTFPKEYGGLGLPYIYRYILLEELDYRDALVVVRGMGDEASFSKTISETDVYLFAGIIGDFNPVHVNEEYAKTTPFKSRVAHGGISMSLCGPIAADLYRGYHNGYREDSRENRSKEED